VTKTAQKLPATSEDNNIMPTLTRNDYITYLHLMKGVTQTELAEMFSINQSRVSVITKKYFKNEVVRNRIIEAADKLTAVVARQKGIEVIESIDVSALPEHSKAQAFKTFIEVARVLDGQDKTGPGGVGIQVNITNYQGIGTVSLPNDTVTIDVKPVKIDKD